MVNSALLLPAHGHAPYLIGVKFLRQNSREIFLPNFYGERQKNILREEFPHDAQRIFLSETLGTLLKPLLLDKESTPAFHDFAKNITTQWDVISKRLGDMLQEGIPFTSLSGARKIMTQFDFALNTGLPVHSPIAPTFFAFVGKLSAVYRSSPYQGDDTLTLARVWTQLEESFAQIFIPRLGSLAYLGCDDSDITFTPPFASPADADETSLPKDSLLMVASGTGVDVHKLARFANKISAPYLTLKDSPASIDLPRVSSHAWGNPNITAILARSGLGTIWQAYLNQKPIGVLTSAPQDDPEVYHNAQMVQWSGIGTIIHDDLSPLMEHLEKYRTAIRQHLIAEKETFGTIDGIAFTASQIKSALNDTAHHYITEREQHEQLLAK